MPPKTKPTPIRTNRGFSDQLRNAGRALFDTVDIGSLVAFRIVFGAMMLWTVWDHFSYDLIGPVYIDPPFHFTFYGFAWIRPWPGDGMYWHFAALGLLSLFVVIGFLYRLSTALLFLGFTYVFLLEKAVYLNHYYLMCLFCLLLVFVPAHRRWSVDAWLRPSLRSDTVPAWALWLLRFQVGLPYLYGGIAKLKADWLCGQPMQIWLSLSPWRIVLGPVAEEPWLALVFSWGGVLFDLAIVPLLLWGRTRPYAFTVAVLFHLMNAFMFDIDVFPWLMIGATTVFFPPDWPRRLLDQARTTDCSPPISTSPARKTVLTLLALYVGFHLVVPFRHWLYPGNVLWTEEGHRFAWHMMLRTKITAIQFLVTDPTTGRTESADITDWLTPRQFNKMGRDPEMLREFAHHIHDRYRARGQGDVEVHVIALCSLNGRKPQFLIDPRVDLAKEERALPPRSYILPLTEPFRWEPWDVPIPEWHKHVSLPPLE